MPQKWSPLCESKRGDIIHLMGVFGNADRKDQASVKYLVQVQGESYVTSSQQLKCFLHNKTPPLSVSLLLFKDVKCWFSGCCFFF